MRSAHCFEDLWVYVLKGDVKVGENFIGVGYGFDEAFGNACGI